MLMKLIKYELLKKWKFSKYLLLGYTALEILLLVVIKLYFGNNTLLSFVQNNAGYQTGGNQASFLFVCLFLLFFAAVGILLIYPFFEGIYRYERDLSGKQAVLELMIPVVSWKKILAKMIAIIFAAVICLIMCALPVLVLSIIAGGNDLSIYISKYINIPDFSLFILAILYLLLQICMLFFFCMAASKSFSHKKRFAVPIGMGIFILLAVLLGKMASIIEEIPIYNFKFFSGSYSLSSIIMDVIVFLILLMSTSWLMEKKIEH